MIIILIRDNELFASILFLLIIIAKLWEHFKIQSFIDSDSFRRVEFKHSLSQKNEILILLFEVLFFRPLFDI